MTVSVTIEVVVLVLKVVVEVVVVAFMIVVELMVVVPVHAPDLVGDDDGWFNNVYGVGDRV